MLSFCSKGGLEQNPENFARVAKFCRITVVVVQPAKFRNHFRMESLFSWHYNKKKIIYLKIYIYSAKFRSACEFLQLRFSALLDSFCHNFFIQTSFWVILVLLEILESVESKYSQKEHF